MKQIFALAVAVGLVAAGCTSSGGSTGGTGGNTTTDTATTAADTGAKADTAGTADTAAASADTAPTTEIKTNPADTSKPDTAKPPAGPTYGDCATSDQSCIQACAQAECMPEVQGCLAGDPKCKSLFDCLVNCEKTPPVMPPQDATPLAQLPDEATPAYCERVCTTQAGAKPSFELSQFNGCIVGKCIDCTKMSGGEQNYCKQECGKFNKCKNELDACAKDADCIDVIYCVSQCSGDKNCANGCLAKAKGKGADLVTTYTTCVGTNADACKAP